MSDTPRTNALLVERRHQDASDWNADDVMAFLRHGRQLERELNEAKAMLHFPSHQQYVQSLKSRDDYRGCCEKLAKLVEVAKCPACDGSGSIPVPIGEHFVSHEMAIDAGDRSMEGQSMGIEWEQQQCQWCDEKDILLAQLQQKGQPCQF